MPRLGFIFSFAVLFAVFAVQAEDAKLPSTITPLIKDKNRHDDFAAIAKKGNIDLLFVGDSITDAWRNRGRKVFNESFGAFNPANFGIAGDRTQHVLWRMQNGELEGIKPKLVVLLIGTNNGADSKEDVALGITTIVKEILKRASGTKVLLLGIFPRNKPSDASRIKNNQVNEIISKLDDGGKTVKFMDIGEKFLDADKLLPKEIMPDALHPNAKGYQIWADAILPTVKEMMGEK